MGQYQEMFNIAAGVALSVGGWFARQLWEAVQSLKDDLSKLREEIARDYTPKNEFRELAHEIRGMFREISNKLDNKVDK